MRKVLFLTILLTGVIYAGGFALTGVGSRGLSLGGSFRAVANDWTALYWNPAGMSYIDQDILGFHNAIVKPAACVEPMTGLLGYDGGYSTVKKVNARAQTFTIPSGGFVKNFKYLKDTKIGLAVFVPFGLGTDWNLYHFPIGYYNPSDTVIFIPPKFPEYNWSSEVKTASMLVGLSKKFKKFSLGIALGPTFERFRIRKVNFFDPAAMDTHALSLPIQYRLFPVDSKIEVKGWALSLHAGAIFRPNERLKLGISGRFYTRATLEGDANLYVYFPYNDAIASRADSLAPLFLGSVASGYGTAKAKVLLPFNIGAGISYKLSDRFLFVADFDYTHWSSFDEIVAEFKDLKIKLGEMELSEITSDTLKEYWKSTFRFGFGLEYEFNDRVTTRGGFYYDPTPIPDSTITPLIPDINTKYGFTLGGEYKIFDFLKVLINYEYIHGGERTFERSENYSYRSSYFAGKYGFHVHALGIGVEYVF